MPQLIAMQPPAAPGPALHRGVDFVKRWAALPVFLLLTFTAAFVGSRFMPDAWYADLDKPAWNPPNAVFGPVWTVLYVLIAVAGFRAWRARHEHWADAALALWGAQLVLNGLWSWLFFGLHRLQPALIDIGLVWLTIVGFLSAAWSRDRTTGWLFVPYLLWVSFASALNFAIWRAN